MITEETLLHIEQKSKLIFNRALFEKGIDQYTSDALDQFKAVTRNYSLFHLCFASIACIELFAFVLFFSFLTKSTVLAFSLAALLLTVFSYFVLLFYLQAKKPEQLFQIRQGFLEAAKQALPFEEGSSESHLFLSHALYRLVHKLQNQEYTYYKLPPSFQTLGPLMEKFSVWVHWRDLHQMKEILLQLIVKEHVEMVKNEPTDLEAHALLANAYLHLSKLYCDPRKLHPTQELIWISPEYTSPQMQQKCREVAERAIEEFKILDQFAPNDPWVHAQLASIYHDLEMPQEEISAYEAILKISATDKDALFRLGVLYFQEGQIAKGLQVYSLLKQGKDPKATELISYYGDN
jgi:tetratricopeptide (TPR) repeat protein